MGEAGQLEVGATGGVFLEEEEVVLVVEEMSRVKPVSDVANWITGAGSVRRRRVFAPGVELWDILKKPVTARLVGF